MASILVRGQTLVACGRCSLGSMCCGTSVISVSFGLLAAAVWGSADFIARFSGKALGVRVVLLGMFGASALMFTVIMWGADETLRLRWDGAWYLLGSGLCMMVATLLLYQGFIQGPITIVAPIVGSYPAFHIIIGMLSGALLSALQLSLMVMVMAGVVIVATCPSSPKKVGGHSKVKRRGGIWRLGFDGQGNIVSMALLAAVGLATSVHLAQLAAPLYGELQTIWMVRCVAFGAIAILFLYQYEPVRVGLRWWTVLLVQGLLDSIGYLAILLGSGGLGSHIVVVIGACCGKVLAVILARLFLREAMLWRQWLGIIVIVIGVMALAWFAGD